MDNKFDANKELDAMLANIRAEKKPLEQQQRPVPQQPRPAPQQQKKEDTAYYSGEVYFAAKRPTTSQAPAAPRAQQPTRAKSATATLRKKIPKDNKKIKFDQRTTLIYIAVILVVSIFMSIYTMSFVKDILGYHRSDEVKTITISEGATTGKVINQLKKQKLIKHKYLCKMFMVFTSGMHNSKDFDTYLSGVYYLKPSMGLETMLLACQEEQTEDTVKVTIPEGYNIRQIAKKLEKAGVCMSDEFIKNVNSATFNYSFINALENKSQRYHAIEGYLYPDTYEFYEDQNASAVINKMLQNFDDRWSDEYQARADEMGWTVDEIITLASIVQKEAADADQMKVIARIFMNRLDSNNFRCLQSNTTSNYLKSYVKEFVSTSEYKTLWARYSTYDCVGLPAGPICCPGDDAIQAVLWPDSNGYYYFCHDKNGKIYCAKTGAEHDTNVYNASLA